MAYYLTVNIEAAGTPTDTTPSAAGHMWYSLDDGSGNPPSDYGFGPVSGASGLSRMIGPGQLYRDDNGYYHGQPKYSSGKIEITKEQYDAMKDFGDHPVENGFDPNYDVLDNSCIDFVYKAFFGGDLTPANILVKRSGNNLVLQIKETTDALTVRNYHSLGDIHNPLDYLGTFSSATTDWFKSGKRRGYVDKIV
ncbi:MAG: hypothetical protein M0009_06810 [Deltaproteobacteria bacterium]|nr:hypothetical protein [Deltaproteobacteria bacterium]